jgi:hypothetical protein
MRRTGLLLVHDGDPTIATGHRGDAQAVRRATVVTTATT